MIGMTTEDITGHQINLSLLSYEKGIPAIRNGIPSVALAPVLLGGSPVNALGQFSGNKITIAPDAPSITIAHEVGHSFGLKDTFPSGNLMNYPPSSPSAAEVDLIWENALYL